MDCCIDREFPSTWMLRHIEQAGLAYLDMKTFTMLHNEEESAMRQLCVARSKLELMQDQPPARWHGEIPHRLRVSLLFICPFYLHCLYDIDNEW